MQAIPLYVSLISLILGLDQAEIVFVGDAMQHQAQLEAARRPGNKYDYTGCFDDIRPYVESADYAVVNLETPIGSTNFTGYPCFNSPASYVDALADAGFDLFLTANNHTLDRGDNGLHATIDSLDRRGLDHIGTYHNRAHRDTTNCLVKNISGIKVGFVNYTYGTNGISVRKDAVVNYIDTTLISRDIETLRHDGAEIITVALHWGNEYQLINNQSQTRLSHYLVDKGVDLVIGGHPHVIQPMEIVDSPATGRKSLIVYSLGNFISNMKTRDTRGGAMLRVKLGRDTDGHAQLIDASYRLIFTLPPENGKNFRVVDARDYLMNSKGLWHNRCKDFVKSATTIFRTHNKNVTED